MTLTSHRPPDARLPRVVVAAPASGHGKTTVATGLMAALARRGLQVSGHKVGPDYIDPSYHALATGCPGRNLDPYLQREELIVPLLRHGAEAGPRPADVAVIEGVMGLFDGALGTNGYASTAHVAALTGTPVILVVDVRAIGRSVAALVQGFATFDPAVSVAGVILNQVGSDRHEAELRSALAPHHVPLVGALRRSDRIATPSRHLGLVPVGERQREAADMLDALRTWVDDGLDLDAIMRIARTAGPLSAPAWDPATALDSHEQQPSAGSGGPGAGQRAGANTRERTFRPVVAAAAGPAFTFRYAENIELLAAAGVNVVDIDPLSDNALPDGCAGLYLGGGFPEVHAEALSSNVELSRAVAELARHAPVVAECAGLTYLCRELDGQPMAGVLDATAAMTEQRTLGYRTATAAGDNLLAGAGQEATGHEFHRTQVTPGSGPVPAWRWSGHDEGFAGATLHASYLHVHWAGHPQLAHRFAQAVLDHAARAGTVGPAVVHGKPV